MDNRPLTIDRESRTPPYMQLVEFARRNISEGVWRPGEKLPSLNEWKRTSGVAGATVQKAMDVLTADGLVMPRPGSGIYVAPAVERRPRRSTERTLAVDNVEFLSSSQAHLLNRLTAQFGAVNLKADMLHPDIRHISLDLLPATVGGLEPVDDVLAAGSGRDLSQPDSLDFMRLRGRHYLVPTFINVWLLGFNSDRFAACGVATPTEQWTWEQMLDAAERLTDPGKNRYGFAVTPPSPVLLGLLLNLGGEFLDATGQRCRLAEPEAVEAARFLRALSRYAPQEPPDLPTASLPQRVPRDFVSGRVAMNFCGLGTVAMVRESGGFEMGVVRFPGRAKQVPLMRGRGWGLDCHALHPEIARESLRILAEFDMWGPSAVRGIPIALHPSYELRGPLGEAYREALREARTVLANVQVEQRGPRQVAAMSLLDSRLQEIIYSPEPVERVLADVARQINYFLTHAEDERHQRID